MLLNHAASFMKVLFRCKLYSQKYYFSEKCPTSKVLAAFFLRVYCFKMLFKVGQEYNEQYKLISPQRTNSLNFKDYFISTFLENDKINI
jgi:hypothetical protein